MSNLSPEEFDQECINRSRKYGTNEFFADGDKFVRYRFEIEQYLYKHLNSSERDVYRFLVFKCYEVGRGYHDRFMFYTRVKPDIAKEMGISVTKLDGALKGLVEKQLLDIKRRHTRAPHTYIIRPPSLSL